MNILVAGGAGYIGSHTCVELINAGHKVICADNLSNSKYEAIRRVEQITNEKIKFYKVDLTDYEASKIIFEEKKLPEFGKTVTKVNYEDGCKVYFEDDSFVICRFSGTEPLLRIFAESSNRESAAKYIEDFRNFLKI